MRKLVNKFLYLLAIIFLFIHPVQSFAVAPLKPLFDNAIKTTQQGNFIQALELWDEFLKLSPKDPAALSNRGNVRLALGDPEGAIADQTASIEILPEEIDPYLNRGIAEEILNRLDVAEADYKWVLQHDSENSSALYNLGNINAAIGNWIKAEDYFGKASSVAKIDFPIARSSHALAIYELGELDEAEYELRSLIRKYPLFADARAGLTAILWHKGSYGEAESNWVAASGLDSRYAQREWLLNIRRWPPNPTKDLLSFLSLADS